MGIGSLAQGLRQATVASPVTAAAPAAAPGAAAAGPSGGGDGGGGAAAGASLLWHAFLLVASGVPYRRRVVSLRDAELSKASCLTPPHPTPPPHHPTATARNMSATHPHTRP